MNDVNRTTVTATIAKDEQLTVKRVYTRNIPFAKYGTKQTIKGLNMINADNHIDIVDVGQNMSGNGWVSLGLLRDSRCISDIKTYDTEPLIKFSRSKLAKQEQRKWDKGLKNLMVNNIVRCKCKGVYMINPYFMIPNNFEEHELIWNGLDDVSE